MMTALNRTGPNLAHLHRNMAQQNHTDSRLHGRIQSFQAKGGHVGLNFQKLEHTSFPETFSAMCSTVSDSPVYWGFTRIDRTARKLLLIV